MFKQSRTLRLSINIYVLNAIYMYYTVAHRSECEEWRLFFENMKVCLCYCSQMHGACGEEILRNTHTLPFSLQSSKAVKGHIQWWDKCSFFPPCEQLLWCFVDRRYRYLQNQKGHVWLWSRCEVSSQPSSPCGCTEIARGSCQLLMKSKKLYVR